MAEKKSRHHFHPSAQIPSAKMPINWTQLCMYTDPHLIELLIYTEFLIVKTPLFLYPVKKEEQKKEHLQHYIELKDVETTEHKRIKLLVQE
jgi:hypothetical protein